MAFTDLSLAFDRVSRAKLWAVVGLMGVEPALFTFMPDLHEGLTASVSYGPMVNVLSLLV